MQVNTSIRIIKVKIEVIIERGIPMAKGLKILGMTLTTIGAIGATIAGTYFLVKKLKEKKAVESTDTSGIDSSQDVINNAKAELMKSKLKIEDQAGSESKVHVDLDNVPKNKYSME